MNVFAGKILSVSIAVVLLLPVESWGLRIGVPSIDDQIKNTSVILVGHFSDTTGKKFIVEEVIKSPVELPKEISVYDPEPHISRWLKFNDHGAASIGTSQTIFFALWGEEEKAIAPALLQWSFWPQGGQTTKERDEEFPDCKLPHSTVSELRDYIVETIKKQSEKTIWDKPLVIPPGGWPMSMMPFRNQGKLTYVLLEVDGDWKVAPSGKEVVKDDKKIKIRAELRVLGDHDDEKYSSESIKRVGDKIELQITKDLPYNKDMYDLTLHVSEDFPVKSVSVSTRDFK